MAFIKTIKVTRLDELFLDIYADEVGMSEANRNASRLFDKLANPSPQLDISDLLDIIQPDSLLSKMEEALRENEHPKVANFILKLQQDAGLQLNPDFDPDKNFVPQGPITKKLISNYEPVTQFRYDDAKLIAQHFVGEFKIMSNYAASISGQDTLSLQ